jgi:hypothetical protein
MSNAEWDIIQEAATDLDAYQSEEEFLNTLVKIYNQYADDSMTVEDSNALRNMYSNTSTTTSTPQSTPTATPQSTPQSTAGGNTV